MSGSIDISNLPSDTSVGSTTNLVTTIPLSGGGGKVASIATVIERALPLMPTVSTVGTADMVAGIFNGSAGLAPADTLPAGAPNLVVVSQAGTVSSVGTLDFLGRVQVTTGASGVATITILTGGASVPSTGMVASNGTSLITASLVGASYSNGTMTVSGATVPSAGLVGSTGSALIDVAFVGPVSYSAGTLTVSAAAVPSAGAVYSNGTTLGALTLAGPLSYATGTLTCSAAAVPSSGVVYSSGSTLGALTLAGPVSYSAGTLTVSAASVPSAGVVYSTGSALGALTLVGASYASGTLTVSTQAPSAGLVYSTGSAFGDATLSGATFSSGTLTITNQAPATAGIVYSTGSAFAHTTLAGALSYASGTLTCSAASVPSAGVVYSNGTTLGALTLVGGTYSSGTLTTGAAWQITDGTNTVTAVSDLIISSGGTLSGSGTGTATVSFGGGSGGGPSIAPGWGTFWSGTAWNKPAASSLTWINQASATYSEISGGPLQIYGGTLGGWHFLSESVSGTFTHTFLFSANGRPGGGDSIGVFVGNTSTNNFMPFYIYYNQSPPTVYVDHWGGLSGGGSYISHPASFNLITNGPPYCFRIQNDGTNLTFWYSSDPVNNNAFTLIYTEALSTFLSSANVIGFGYLNNDSTSQHTSIALYGLT